MRFELRRLTDYSEEAMLNEIRRVAESVQQPTLSRSEFRKHSRVSPTTIIRRFGSWEKALQSLGFADRFDSSNKRVPRQEVLVELARVSKLLGVASFSREQFNAQACFTDSVVRRAFGSWHKGMKAAGLVTNALGKRYTDDDCIENLLSVWVHNGRAPTHDEMKGPPSLVGPKAYIRRFGTWTNALQAFVDRVNAVPPPAAEIEDSEQESPVLEETVVLECDRREIRLGLRYAVLKRGCFRCVNCGRSPATHLGVVLHVDHVVPLERGGKTTLDNLRSLCEDCNLGKGARHEG
jgi:hypothetical protein